MKYSFNSLETKTFANRLLKCVDFGAKWQEQRMYSEEDLSKAWENGRNGTKLVGNFPFVKNSFKYNSFKEWFEQFKKK
jgi:hypothetical protein